MFDIFQKFFQKNNFLRKKIEISIFQKVVKNPKLKKKHFLYSRSWKIQGIKKIEIFPMPEEF